MNDRPEPEVLLIIFNQLLIKTGKNGGFLKKE